MKAIGFKTSLNIEEKNSLFEFEKEKPQAKGKEILVKISATSINPVDYKIRSLFHQNTILDEPIILGFDAVGIVEEIGEEVKNIAIGDKVYYSGDYRRAGSNAEYQLVDCRVAAQAPKSLTDAQIAVIPLTALTAWEGLFDRIKVDKSKNKTLLVIGGAGGVGSMVIQLAKKLTNLTVIATASREESINWCKSMGADYVANHKDLINSVRELDFKNVDYIYNAADTKGHWEATTELIAPQGSICEIVEFEGELDMMKLQGKSVTVAWEVIYTRIAYETNDVEEQHKILKQLSALIDKGVIKTTLSRTLKGFNVENIKEAHRLSESGKIIGKIAIDYIK